MCERVLTLSQDEMAGEAATAGFSTEDDVVQYIKELRAGTGN
jgi:hypothetical protein